MKSPSVVSLDGNAAVHALLSEPSPRDHIVQLYDDAARLLDNVVVFASGGARAGQAVVIVASQAHNAALAPRLAGLGDAISVHDAEAALAEILDGGEPSWDRFRATVGPILDAALERRPGATVRLYGEVVDLLWRAGRHDAALVVEGFCAELARSREVSILCAYAKGHGFHTDDAFDRVCRAHSHVIPAAPSRAELEAALVAARARAEAAELRAARYQAVVTGLVGHDLRSPLGAVMMGAEYLVRLQLGDKPSRHAHRIAASAVRMSRMIDQVLDYTRIELGEGVVLAREPVDLVALCDRVREGVELEGPPCAITTEVVGDPRGNWDHDGLVQALSTVIGNAATHGRGAVAIRLDGTGADMVVTVHNDGAVAPGMLGALFEPASADRKRHKAMGLGLGLWVARRLILAHGGSLDVTSSDAAGTVVRIALPRDAARATSAPR